MHQRETLDCCSVLWANMNMVRELARGPGCVRFCVCMWVWAWLCRCGLMLCDWGQCCQQSRDMDAAQVPPCINAGMLILLSHYLTFKGPIRNSGSSSIMGSHTTNQGEMLVLAVQCSGAKVLIFRKFSQRNEGWTNHGWSEVKKWF